VYEGYAAGGVAVIVEAATDNKNRTAAEIRSIFVKNNGSLASTGSVSYMFHKKGQITVPRSSINEDQILELALDAGAEELTTEEDQYVITTSHDQLYAIAEALKKAGVTTDGQKFTFIPDTTVAVKDEAVARQVLRLCDALEDDDDVQSVYSNTDAVGSEVGVETLDRPASGGRENVEGAAETSDPVQTEPEFGEGIIEISGKGFGFLRDPKRNFVQTPQDIFVTPEIVRRFALRDGMWIYGETRRGSRGPQLVKLLTINGEEPPKYQGLRPFEELTTINPNKKIKLETVPDR